jgi:hypothetical protein
MRLGLQGTVWCIAVAHAWLHAATGRGGACLHAVSSRIIGGYPACRHRAGYAEVNKYVLRLMSSMLYAVMHAVAGSHCMIAQVAAVSLGELRDSLLCCPLPYCVALTVV